MAHLFSPFWILEFFHQVGRCYKNNFIMVKHCFLCFPLQLLYEGRVTNDYLSSFSLSFSFSLSSFLIPSPALSSLPLSLSLSFCVSLMAMVWCLRHIWCKCWVKESGREQGVSGIQSGYPWLTLSGLRSSAVRQAFLGLLQSSVITLGGKRTLHRWEWGWGDQDLFSHPGWASEDHGVNPMLDISVCLSDPASALQIPALKADLQQCHHPGLLPSGFHWVWSVGKPAGGRRGATSLSDNDFFPLLKAWGPATWPLSCTPIATTTQFPIRASFLTSCELQVKHFPVLGGEWGWRLSPSLAGWFQMCYSLSCVQLFVTPWTVARQAPLFTEFSRQEYWSG